MDDVLRWASQEFGQISEKTHHQQRHHPELSGFQLKKFQVEGVAWVLSRFSQGLGCILGDEMGLGKTCQAIAACHSYRTREDPGSASSSSPTLVICPLSVVDVWKAELARLAPSLTVKVYIGVPEDRKNMASDLERFYHSIDFIITTPQLILQDCSRRSSEDESDVAQNEDVILKPHFFTKHSFAAGIVDEAHSLKNPQTVLYNALRQIAVRNWLLLTGTPVQNNLKELWSLLSFVSSARAGSMEAFTTYFAPLQDRGGDDQGAGFKLSEKILLADLSRLTKLLMLRRTKADVPGLSLKGLRDVVILCNYSAVQRKLYRDILAENAANLTSAGRSAASNVLVQLRKCCNHPYLFDGIEPEPFVEGSHIVEAAGKLLVLDKLLEELVARGSKVLVFSQMTRMLDILQDYLAWRGYGYDRLDGSMRREERAFAVNRFKASTSPSVFLMSTRAGGLGLNLTEADTVVLYDSDWNPQGDLQALARSHRIGQARPVTALRLVMANSVEEVILRRARQKLGVSDLVLGSSSAGGATSGSLAGPALQKVVCFGLAALLEGAQDDQVQPFTQSDARTVLHQGDARSLEADGQGRRSPIALGAQATAFFLAGTHQFKTDYRDVKIMHTEETDLGALEALAVSEDRQPSARRRTAAKPAASAESRSPPARPSRAARWAAAGYVSLALPGPSGDESSTPATPVAGSSAALDIEFVVGDVTKPEVAAGGGVHLVCVCVDNSGVWASRGGIFTAIGHRYKQAVSQYERAKKYSDLRQGMVQCISAGEDVRVCLMVTQGTSGEVKSDKLAECLERIRLLAKKEESDVTCHFPRYSVDGQRTLYGFERLLRSHLREVRVMVYYFDRNRKRTASPPETHVAPRRPRAIPEDLFRGVTVYATGSQSRHSSARALLQFVPHGGGLLAADSSNATHVAVFGTITTTQLTRIAQDPSQQVVHFSWIRDACVDARRGREVDYRVRGV